MKNLCNLHLKRGVLFGKEGGLGHVWTLLKPVGCWDLANLFSDLSSCLALQPILGLFLQRKNRCRLGRLCRFKNHEIHLVMERQ
jgi:hypothetical protein